MAHELSLAERSRRQAVSMQLQQDCQREHETRLCNIPYLTDGTQLAKRPLWRTSKQPEYTDSFIASIINNLFAIIHTINITSGHRFFSVY